MPTVFRYEGYRFYFYSNEHIHIENGDGYARVVLKTLEVTDSYTKRLEQATQDELRESIDLLEVVEEFIFL